MKNSKTKRLLSILLAVMMVVGMIPATAIPVGAATISGTTGTGTEADPIIVDTYEELKAAMELEDAIYVLVEEGTYIEVPERIESIDNKKLKVLTVNGTLSGEESLLRFKSPTIIQGNGEIRCSNSYCIVVGVSDETTIKGDLTFESGHNNGDITHIIGVSSSGTLVIEGGTFISTVGLPTSFAKATEQSLSRGRVFFKGGYFPQGIGFDYHEYFLEDGYLYSYDDHTVSTKLTEGKPVEVVPLSIGFETQSPAMPEGETVTHLGNFEVGSAEAKITFSFNAKPLAVNLVNAGLSVTEYMKVVSSKRGVIIEQNSGAAYTIDNTVADSYTIIQTITYKENNIVFNTIKHSFTLTINPQGYVQDPDCPVEGATGTGTEEDPIIVDTYEELKAAMELEDAIYVLVEEGTYIEVPERIESIDNKKLKVLTVNGTLSGEESLLMFKSPTIIQGNGKIHCSNSYCIVVGVSDETTIKGDLTFESGHNNGDITHIIGVSSSGTLVIEGGTFISTAGLPTSFAEATEQSLSRGRVFFKGGYFPQGIGFDYHEYFLEDGCLYIYDNGTISTKLTEGKPVEVFSLGFATQSPAMPEGETYTHLGNFKVGSADAKITFSFKAKPMSDFLLKGGLSVTEYMKVVSSKRGVIKEQNSGAAYTIDNTVADSYTITETITLIDNGTVFKTIKHIFTVTINPNGYVQDTDCPIEGATGTGTEADPVIVDNFAELKAALEFADELYIQVDGYIECLETLKPTENKTLTINGTLHSVDLFPMLDITKDNFVLQGEGEILNEGIGSCIDCVGNNMLIKGNIKFQCDGSGGYYTIGVNGGSLTIFGGEFLGLNGRSLIGFYGSVVLMGGNYPNGIYNQSTAEISLTDGDVYLYNDGTISKDLQENRGVSIFRLIDKQAPEMPVGENTVVLGGGKVQSNSGEIGFSFNATPLPALSKALGYTLVEKMSVYSEKQDAIIYTQDHGRTYYLSTDTLDNLTVYQTITLLDADGNIVDSVEYSYIANIGLYEVNIEVANPDDQTAYIRGELKTKGVNLDLAKWFLVNTDGTLTENGSKIFVPGNTYRYVVDLGLDEHYVFANGYTVKINGEDASRNEDGTWYKDFVARKKLKPIVEQDTYFFQSGTTREIRVDAHGDGVTYSWTGVSDGAGGYYTVSDYTERVQRLRIPEGAEGTNKYLVRFKDEYGDTAERMITVHITSMGFKEIKPTPTAEQFEAGVTDYGYVFPGADGSGVPKVYFEAYELSQGYIDEGYTMETSLIDYVDGVKVGEGYEAWEYTTHLPGAHEIVQKIVIKDAEGNVFKEYTYTHKMNVMREFALLTAAYGTALYGYRVEVYQDGKLASEQTNDNDITMDVVAPVGDVKIVVSKNGYKAREYEATIPADGFFSLNAEILRWGDANLDDVLDVQDYQQTINKGLSDNHKLDGSYEQSVIDWAEDGYVDVVDCYYCDLCINGSVLFSASVEYDKYYGTGGETIKIPVVADGFGVTYEWRAPEGAPSIVDGTEDEATVKIGIESGKYNIGDKFTYTCIVRDRFFSYAELEVELEIEHLANLYAVTYSYSSQYEDITGIPGKTRVKAGESITIPELIPQLDGYTFMYWYAGSDRLNPGDTYTPYQNTIIMPYMAKDYEITLYSGIEGELFGTHIGNYGHYYYLPEMDYMPEGYVFYGWTDVEGSTEVKYTTGYRYEIKGDANLYPVIAKASDVKLTIYANDGTDTVIYTQTLAEAGASFFTIPEDLEMPTRDGYVCRYFYTDPNYVHGDYHEERLFFPGDEIKTGADGIELYVIWIGEYSVTYDSGTDDNNVYVPYPEMYEYGDYARVSTDKPYREGYNFLYWEDANGTKYYGDEYISVKSAIVLTAVWEKADHYDIWVGGQRVSKSEPVVQCGDGTATVVDDNGNLTLVLNNATITGSEGIRTTYYSLDVEVNGENTISLYGNGVKGMDITGYFYISGTGTLNIDVLGDGAIGINGLYSIDYVTVNVEATPETSDGEAIGVTANSGSTYSMYFNNGAVLNASGTYGIYNAGSMSADITSKVNVEGTKYGIYSVADFMSFGGTFVGKGDIAAIRSTNMYFYSYHPKSMVTEYNTNKSNFSFTKKTWDGDEYFCDGDSGVHGYKYVTVHPAECTGEHSLDVYKGYAATCEKNGLLDSTYCTACGYVVAEREEIPALGHNYNTYAGGKAPTCTEQGVKGTYTQCDNCGEYVGEVEFIEPTWHSWGEWIFVEDHWYEEYGYGEKLYVRYCNDCNEYQETWYWYEDPNDTGSPNDWESGGAGPGKP